MWKILRQQAFTPPGHRVRVAVGQRILAKFFVNVEFAANILLPAAITAVAPSVDALWCKPEGRDFEPRSCYWILSILPNPYSRTMPWSSLVECIQEVLASIYLPLQWLLWGNQ